MTAAEQDVRSFIALFGLRHEYGLVSAELLEMAWKEIGFDNRIALGEFVDWYASRVPASVGQTDPLD